MTDSLHTSVPHTLSPKPVNSLILILVAKAAVPGRVKTRLINPLSADQAAAVHSAFLNYLRIMAEDWKSQTSATRQMENPPFAPDLDLVLLFDALGQSTAAFQWPGWRKIPQSAGDLGTRMRLAAEACFADGADAIIFIGVDSVHVTIAQLDWIWKRLMQADAVMLPAHDGGYIALGLWQEALPALDGIAWGTSVVARQTEERVRAAGLQLERGKEMPDIDTLADLRHLLTQLSSREDSAAQSLYSYLRLIVPEAETGV